MKNQGILNWKIKELKIENLGNLLYHYFIGDGMSNYLNRYIESSIKRKLRTSGAVLIAGPKFCGKTTTGSLFAKSIYRINHYFLKK